MRISSFNEIHSQPNTVLVRYVICVNRFYFNFKKVSVLKGEVSNRLQCKLILFKMFDTM